MLQRRANQRRKKRRAALEAAGLDPNLDTTREDTWLGLGVTDWRRPWRPQAMPSAPVVGCTAPLTSAAPSEAQDTAPLAAMEAAADADNDPTVTDEQRRRAATSSAACDRALHTLLTEAEDPMLPSTPSASAATQAFNEWRADAERRAESLQREETQRRAEEIRKRRQQAASNRAPGGLGSERATPSSNPTSYRCIPARNSAAAPHRRLSLPGGSLVAASTAQRRKSSTVASRLVPRQRTSQSPAPTAPSSGGQAGAGEVRTSPAPAAAPEARASEGRDTHEMPMAPAVALPVAVARHVPRDKLHVAQSVSLRGGHSHRSDIRVGGRYTV